MKLILASKSPRRKEIFENLGIEFEIIVSEADEESGERDPAALVKELSLRKGRAVADKIIEKGGVSEETYIISSDTVVATGGETPEILGKPKDRADAERMLSLIEGRGHYVHSGIGIIKLTPDMKKEERAATESTRVEFSHMTKKDIEFYIDHEKVYDKAGAYAIQGIASAWINKIDGDYFNVVGLPVHRMFDIFKTGYGIDPEDLMGRK